MADFDKLWNYGDPAATERAFRDVLPQIDADGGQDLLVQLRSQIARTYSLRGMFEEAHRELDEIASRLDAPEVKLGKVRYYLERGRTFNSSNGQSEALPLFLQAYELAYQLGEHRYAVDALHMIAIAERDPNVQVEWNLRAIEHAERTNEIGWLFALYNNIGESYLQLGQYEKAHDYFSRLAKLQKERRGAEDIYTLKDLAKAARLAGRPAESLDVIMPVLDKLLLQHKDDGYIRQEYAEALYALGEPSSAKPHFAKAYELLSQDPWAVENEPLERLRSLS